MGFLNKPKLQVFLATFCSFTIFVPWGQTTSIAQAATKAEIKLQPIYEQYGKRFDVPWGILAGIDRYAELSKTKADRNEHPFYGYAFDDVAWSGLSNPNSHDIDPMTISLFGGLGVDANRDRIASQIEAEDRIAALASWIDLESGESDLDECVWALFQDPVAMDRVFAFSRIFETFGLHPEGHCFPVDKRYNYTVKHTFGAGRSFGGRRIHEGVDIFASYGTPVLACSYGYVELMGWNRFGGWRVGIRDGDNYYYYYAHLSSFAKGVKQGSLVRPGQVIGYVGSTGYGPPGTAGKFPPHLHFGIYREIGHREWAFSPSSMLASWERQKQTVMRVKS